MKASTLLVHGAFVALTSTAAMSPAQPPPPPPSSDFHVSTKASMAASQNVGSNHEATPPAPRGDLRGDIASNVRGVRPESIEYGGSAESLREVWVAVRASLRSVLEEVTLADVARSDLPDAVRRLVADPEAWAPHP